jgi:hypothetical protein
MYGSMVENIAKGATDWNNLCMDHINRSSQGLEGDTDNRTSQEWQYGDEKIEMKCVQLYLYHKH